jgi:hypothetical protein
MASTSVTVITPTLLGAVITGASSVATGETITIQASTAQSALDFKSLFVRVSAVGGSVTPTISVGTRYSSVGQGAKALTAIASSTSAIIGGQDFESSRFLNTAGTLIMSFVGTGTASIECYQYPRASE